MIQLMTDKAWLRIIGLATTANNDAQNISDFLIECAEHIPKHIHRAAIRAAYTISNPEARARVLSYYSASLSPDEVNDTLNGITDYHRNSIEAFERLLPRLSESQRVNKLEEIFELIDKDYLKGMKMQPFRLKSLIDLFPIPRRDKLITRYEDLKQLPQQRGIKEINKSESISSILSGLKEATKPGSSEPMNSEEIEVSLINVSALLNKESHSKYLTHLPVIVRILQNIGRAVDAEQLCNGILQPREIAKL
jgi:hypothetical protein